MPKGTPLLRPSARDDYETPHEFFDALWDEVGGFDLDPCCTPNQHTAQRVLEAGGRIYIPPNYNYEEVNPVLAQAIVDRREATDGLTQPWHGRVYMNPPYGLALRKWVPKAVHEVECDNAELVMALLPAHTGTIWWQQYVIRAVTYDLHSTDHWNVDEHSLSLTEVRFIKGRLTFVGAPDPAGFASALVVWRR